MSKQGNSYKIIVLAGDGIGPEIIKQAEKTIRAIEFKFNHSFDLIYSDFGAISIDKHGIPFTLETENLCLESDAILLGAIGDPKYDNDPTIKVRPEQGLLALRKVLGLFSNIRPLKIYDSLKEISPLKSDRIQNVDIEIYRELTGGIYFGEKEFNEITNTAYDICSYSEIEIRRIAIKAFEAAGKRKNKLTLVDKANVLATSKLWRQVVKEIQLDYPNVVVDFMYVDNAAMQLLINPSQFDVLLTENMFGDILSDEASVLSGSIGLLPSASIGEKHALFEPIHGSYPQAKGKGIANPIATILSVAMMMDYFNLTEEATMIREAVDFVIENKILTPDLNPIDAFSTDYVGDVIACLIESELPLENISLENALANRMTII
ncbi:MAG: 3-isopropylmalate dehydrogenase [Flavobacteriia bacterium]|nr:3-isopropylmalate dehydrogenase [Flavobacteriia bacterium]